MDIDTDSCYDLIVPNFGILTLQKYGINSKVCVVQGATLAEIKYKLITDLGISEEYYKHCTVFFIYGTDQNSAVSPTVWIVILNLFIDTHEKK